MVLLGLLDVLRSDIAFVVGMRRGCLELLHLLVDGRSIRGIPRDLPTPGDVIDLTLQVFRELYEFDQGFLTTDGYAVLYAYSNNPRVAGIFREARSL